MRFLIGCLPSFVCKSQLFTLPRSRLGLLSLLYLPFCLGLLRSLSSSNLLHTLLLRKLCFQEESLLLSAVLFRLLFESLLLLICHSSLFLPTHLHIHRNPRLTVP